ncbi:MAG: MATE family efflux transporter [Saprospiraceae bacterium]|nr:MATE family efflux transporter [Saprospiraceae bacterium]
MTESLKADTTVKGIILLTLPISLARLVPELNFLFNAIFLGHLGTTELAYAALSGVYYLIFAAMGYGLSNAILSMISRQAGENNRLNIVNTLRHGYLLAAILAFVAIVITFFGLHSIMVNLGVSLPDAHAVSGFMNIRIFGLIFLFGYQLSNSYLICIQETKWLLFASVIESVVNIILDYWFIFGGWGLTPMGFNGAAYASVISEIVGFAAVGFLIVYKKFSIKYDIPNIFEYKSKLLKSVFIQASPLMAQYAISIIAWWIFYVLINRNYNYAEQAASQAMRNLFGISGVFSWAFGASTNTILSNILGQGRRADFLPVLKRIMYISATGMLIFIVLVNLIPNTVFALYGQQQEFSNVGTLLLRVVTSAMLMLTIGVIWLNAVVATGNTRFVFLTELTSIIAYLIYVFYVIEVKHFSVSVAWMSEWLYWTVMFLMSFFYIRFWKRKQLTFVST